MKIYLVRHGETEWNKEYRLQGQADTQLNDYGRELAQITAEALKDIPFDVIFHSPLSRAKETAYILKRDRKIEIIGDERLREMSFGIAEGCNIREIKDNPQDPMYNFLKFPDRRYRLPLWEPERPGCGGPVRWRYASGSARPGENTAASC